MEKNKHTHCTMCGKELDKKDKEMNFQLDKFIGYGSKHKYKHIKFDLCCDCFDKVVDTILPMFKNMPIEESNNIIDGNAKPIYTIATIEKLETNKHGFLDTGDERTVGFFHEFHNAEFTVVNNCGDLNETIYDYAIIEEVQPGEYTCSKKRWFYKYNAEKDCYEKIDEPECVKNYVAITMG